MGTKEGSETFRSIVLTRVQCTNLQVFAADVVSSDALGSPSYFSQLTFTITYKLSSQFYDQLLHD